MDIYYLPKRYSTGSASLVLAAYSGLCLDHSWVDLQPKRKDGAGRSGSSLGCVRLS